MLTHAEDMRYAQAEASDARRMRKTQKEELLALQRKLETIARAAPSTAFTNRSNRSNGSDGSLPTHRSQDSELESARSVELLQTPKSSRAREVTADIAGIILPRCCSCCLRAAPHPTCSLACADVC
jgi:hypothetical protein